MDAPTGQRSLKELYARRFGPKERAQKNALWKVLCQSFLQRYVSESDVVVDLGAGYCEFINNIRCGRKIAVDLNEETRQYAADDVTVLLEPADALSSIEDATVDIVFASNLFEHLPDKEVLTAVLAAIHRVLRHGGRLLVLQPNIRYAYREYWDYFDHYLPLSHLSLSEVLMLKGFTIEEVRPRFLPYTVKSRLPKSGFLLKIYLRLPPLHLLMGKQMFLVAAKAGS
jgi:SAM-dependent methyltransferase